MIDRAARRPLGIAIRLALFALVSLSARDANAQLKWDASAEVGLMKRVLNGRAPATGDASIGPIGELRAHLGIIPLVRAGVYLSHDISPQGDAPARQITSAGLELKASSPFALGGAKLSLLIGAGYARVYAPSYDGRVMARLPASALIVNEPATIEGSGGGFAEIPLALHVDYKLRSPWVLSASLGMRFAFAFTGDVYEDPGRPVMVPPTSPAPTLRTIAPVGTDTFAPFLTIGVGLDL